MPNNKSTDAAGTTVQTLRQRAEDMVRVSPSDLASMTDHDIQRLVYELQIHQVEIELQNDELRASQLELASSRDRFSNLYDFAPVGYLTLDNAGVILEANLTAASLLGVERAKLLGSKFSRFVVPDSQNTSHFYWQKVFGSTQREICELEMHRPDDSPVFVRLESARFDSPHEPTTQCRVALVDIADIRQAKQELQLLNSNLEQRISAQVSEIELLAKAVANLGEGVLITNDHKDWQASHIIFANKALCDMLGYTVEEVLQQSPGILLGQAVDAVSMQELQQQLAANQTFHSELTYKHRDGTCRHITLLTSPLFNTENRSTNYVTVLRDITDHKQAELQLRNRKQRLQAILDTVPDGIITIDAHGIVQNCNPATQRLFGFSEDELVGQNISLLMPSPYREEHDSYLRHFRETGERRIIGSSRQLSAQHRDGHLFPIIVSVSEIDHLGLYLGVIQDVSELRKLQQEVLLAADRVQWHIGQALHDGPQQALAGLGLLSRGLALDLASSASPFEAQAQRVSEGIRDANYAIRKLARGLIPAPVGRGGLYAALQKLAQETSETYGINCEFLCPEPIRITEEYTVDQLYHIAQEATLNAANHSGADRISISIEQQGPALTLRVVDNGCGFASDEKKDNSPGLGLYIMPYRAATIDGIFSVSGLKNGGTTVCCTIPCANDPNHPPPTRRIKQ